jgi:hypothetical protein
MRFWRSLGYDATRNSVSTKPRSEGATPCRPVMRLASVGCADLSRVYIAKL